MCAHDLNPNRNVSHLIEVVVPQTVGKIQVLWVSWNRIPSSRRIKPYIHGASGGKRTYSKQSSVCFYPFLQSGERNRPQLSEERRDGKRCGDRGRTSNVVLLWVLSCSPPPSYTLLGRFIAQEHAWRSDGLQAVPQGASDLRRSRCVCPCSEEQLLLCTKKTRVGWPGVGPPLFLRAD